MAIFLIIEGSPLFNNTFPRNYPSQASSANFIDISETVETANPHLNTAEDGGLVLEVFSSAARLSTPADP